MCAFTLSVGVYLASLGEGALLTHDQDKISATVAKIFLYVAH